MHDNFFWNKYIYIYIISDNVAIPLIYGVQHFSTQEYTLQNESQNIIWAHNFNLQNDNGTLVCYHKN